VSAFLARLANILETDEVYPEDRLVEMANWDSVSALSVMAMADAQYGVSLMAEDLVSLATAGDLERFVLERVGGSPR
jgi:acyl carrier protein